MALGNYVNADFIRSYTNSYRSINAAGNRSRFAELSLSRRFPSASEREIARLAEYGRDSQLAANRYNLSRDDRVIDQRNLPDASNWQRTVGVRGARYIRWVVRITWDVTGIDGVTQQVYRVISGYSRTGVTVGDLRSQVQQIADSKELVLMTVGTDPFQDAPKVELANIEILSLGFEIPVY